MQFKNQRLENDLIRHALCDDDKLSEVSVKVPPKVFSSSVVREIYKIILSHWDHYGKRIPFQDVEFKLRKLPYKPDEMETNVQLAKSLFVAEPPSSDFNFLKDEVVKLWRFRQLSKALDESMQSLNDHNLDRGQGALRDVLDEPLFAGSDEVREYEFSESIGLVIRKINEMKKDPDKFRGIPTGIPELDAHIKGIMPAEVGLIVGRTGGYKSTALYNFAIEAYLAGFTTMLVTIEMSGEQILRRLYSRISNIPVNSLDEALTDDKELERMRTVVEQYGRRLKSKLYIVDVSQGCTIDLLRAKVREYTRRSPVAMVVIDYMQIMDTRGGEQDLYDWKAQAILSKKLKETARLFDISIWTAAQLVAGGQYKKGEDSAEDIAYSKAVGQNVDIMIKIASNTDENHIPTAEMRMLKMRRKFRADPITINPEPVFGRIHDAARATVVKDANKGGKPAEKAPPQQAGVNGRNR